MATITTESGDTITAIFIDEGYRAQISINGEIQAKNASWERFTSLNWFYGPRLAKDPDVSRNLYKKLSKALALERYNIDLDVTQGSFAPHEIPYHFTPSNGPEVDDVSNKFAKFVAAQAKWVNDYNEYHGDFTWERWRDIAPEILNEVFSEGELLKIQHSTCLMSELSEFTRHAHPFINKVFNTHWLYGASNSAKVQDFNHIIACFDKLRSLTFAPDFEIKLTYAPAHNKQGYSPHFNEKGQKSLYIDASMAMCIYHKGKHVLTVGFAPCRRGVVVAQVQLREKHGNRFLYKLPKKYLDVALDSLYRAFGDEVWLVTGESAAKAVVQSYGKEQCTASEEDLARIKAFYDQPLADFSRTEEVFGAYCGRDFVRLKRV